MREIGFVLLPVTLLLAVIAAAAWMVSREGAAGAGRVVRAEEAHLARYVAEAGLAHAEWAAGTASCAGYALPDTAFGAHVYSAVFTPSFGSPVSIAATATLAGGTQRTVSRRGVPMYEPAQSVSIQPDAAAGNDTFLDQWFADTPKGNALRLESRDVSGANALRPLLRFDLSSIPAQATITSATLELWLEQNSFDPVAISAHRVTAAWNEATATWNERDAGVPWTTPGGDFDPAPLATTTVAPTTDVFYGWPITDLARAWHAGTQPNHGVILVAPTGSNPNSFSASDGSTPAQWPRLTVTYACECGAAPSETMILQPGASDGADAWIGNRLASEENSNNGAADRVRVSSGARHGLLRFDLSALPAQAIVESATLSLHLLQHEPGEMTVAVHRVSAPWAEGNQDGGGTPDGATWHTHDGVTAWGASGGDYDATASDTVTVSNVDGTRSEWDVTTLAQAWAADPSANHGMLLRYVSGDSLDHFFASSDHSITSNHPRLTVSFRCPCGVVCPAGGYTADFGTRALLVVDDPAALVATEAEKRTLIESFGFTTSLIDSAAPAADFRAAALVNDVVFVGEDVLSGDLDTRLTGTHLGVVNEEPALADELAIWTGHSTGTASVIDIVDNGHYVTQDFAIGPLTLFTSAQPVASASGTIAGGVEPLGRLSGVTALAAVDKLAALTGGAPAPGRRVQLPWIGDYVPGEMTPDAHTLLRRALEWAATLPDPTTAAYFDRFESATCDPATAYANSDGQVDWSGRPWTERNDVPGDPCAGSVKIVSDGGSKRLFLSGFDRGAERLVDLAGATWATLSLVYRRDSLDDAGEWVAVEVSPDGGANWTEVGRIEGPGSDAEYLPLAFDIAPFAGPLTGIRLVAQGMSVGGGSPDAVYVDDVRIETDAAGDGACAAVLSDDFESGDFAGSPGSAAWSADWTEIGEVDGAGAGNVTVSAFGGSQALGVESKDRGAWRGADLSAFTSAVLSYRWRRENLGNQDFVTVEISGNGGASWTQLEQLSGVATDTDWQTSLFDVSVYLGTDTRIRFLSNNKMGAGDLGYFDDVSVCLY